MRHIVAKFKKIGDQLEPKLKSVSRFKVGKTGKTIEEIYHENYADIYTSYHEIGSYSYSMIIDDFEKYLLNRFMDFPNCDNKEIVNTKMISSNRYIVYLMYS